MDKSVKRMLKLIEEDGDSFAKKAEMYYQKRPELIFLVEEFYRMYRSLAERYDHVTGELRKSIPCDLQSQGSGISGSEIGSEQSSTLPSPRKHGGHHRKSSNRAAGFDFFLGSASAPNPNPNKEGYESSTLSDSDDESDDSSINNDSGFPVPGNINEHHGQSRKIMELEIELRDLKEKLWLQEEENHQDVHAKYKQELRTLNEKLRVSEEQVERLRSLSLEAAVESEPDSNIIKSEEERLEASKHKIASLEFEATKSSERIQQLQDEVDSTCKDIAVWKAKFISEKRDNSKLLERLASMKINLLDQDHEIMDLKAALSKAEQQISMLPEKSGGLEEEMRKINSGKGEIERREKNIQDLKASVESIKVERDHFKGMVKRRDDQVEQLVWHLNQLHMEHVKLMAGMEEARKQVKELEEEVERQRAKILEGAEEKREAIRQLCFSLEHYRNHYDRLPN